MVIGCCNCSSCPYWLWRELLTLFHCEWWGTKITVLFLWKKDCQSSAAAYMKSYTAVWFTWSKWISSIVTKIHLLCFSTEWCYKKCAVCTKKTVEFNWQIHTDIIVALLSQRHLHRRNHNHKLLFQSPYGHQCTECDFYLPVRWGDPR